MREIFFHEDDCCQQQLLPRSASGNVLTELKKKCDFADAHRAPNGFGWTDMYVLQDFSPELRALRIDKVEFAEIVSPFLQPFDLVFTGFSSYREQCRMTGAWGRSRACSLFADWNEAGIISNVWAGFFEPDEESILAATAAVAAIGKRFSLLYVDWAWDYLCDADDELTFSSLLRAKMEGIAQNLRSLTQNEEEKGSF
jgi:hypothetical protein